MIELVASITEATNVLQNKTERLTNENIQSYITIASKYLDQSDLHRFVFSISTLLFYFILSFRTSTN